jgi:hypothetical protein
MTVLAEKLPDTSIKFRYSSMYSIKYFELLLFNLFKDYFSLAFRALQELAVFFSFFTH